MTMQNETFDAITWIHDNKPSNIFSALIAKFRSRLQHKNLTAEEINSLFESLEQHLNQRGIFSLAYNTRYAKHVGEYLDWLAINGKNNTLMILWKAGAASSDVCPRLGIHPSLYNISYEEFTQVDQSVSFILKTYEKLFAQYNFAFSNPAVHNLFFGSKEEKSKYFIKDLTETLNTLPLDIKNKTINQLFHKAISSDQKDLVVMLLAIPEIKENAASTADNKALRWAAQNGHLDVVSSLLEIPAVLEAATADNNYALRYAVQNGHLAVVNCLLEIPTVLDAATADNNEALRLAAKHGHLEVLNRLLDIPQVAAAATADNNRALILAAQNKHVDVVNRLLKEPAVLELANNQLERGEFNYHNVYDLLSNAIAEAARNLKEREDVFNQILPQPLAEEVGPQLSSNYAYRKPALLREPPQSVQKSATPSSADSAGQQPKPLEPAAAAKSKKKK